MFDILLTPMQSLISIIYMLTIDGPVTVISICHAAITRATVGGKFN